MTGDQRNPVAAPSPHTPPSGVDADRPVTEAEAGGDDREAVGSRTGELAADGASLLWDGYTDERDKHYRREYGMKAVWVEEIIADQGGRCPVCGRKLGPKARPVLDEDHETGEVYGVPCDRCNRTVLAGPQRARLLAYLTDPPARRVGPYRVPASRLAAKQRRARQRAARAAVVNRRPPPQRRAGSAIAAIERLEQER